MLALVTTFLATFVVAMVAVWLYRLIFNWKGFNHNIVEDSRVAATVPTKLNGQRGYVKLAQRSKEAVKKPVRQPAIRQFNTARGELKAPWGW